MLFIAIYILGVIMKFDYKDFVTLLKVISDETRLKIIDLLSCGELCACELLKNLDITQPTLSYHMKVLSECGIVNADRHGAWMHYTLNDNTVKQIGDYWNQITSEQQDCICYQYAKNFEKCDNNE